MRKYSIEQTLDEKYDVSEFNKMVNEVYYT